jgi:hypothetical protein
MPGEEAGAGKATEREGQGAGQCTCLGCPVLAQEKPHTAAHNPQVQQQLQADSQPHRQEPGKPGGRVEEGHLRVAQEGVAGEMERVPQGQVSFA